MKAYNLRASKHEIAGKTANYIQLGQEGNRRKRSYVRCAATLFNGVAIQFAYRYQKGGTSTLEIIRGGLSGDTWLAQICAADGYQDGEIAADGGIFVAKNAAPHYVIAKGYGAFGDPDRDGQWDDILITVRDHTVVRVRPNRGADYYLWFKPARVLVLQEAEARARGISTDVRDYIRV